MYFFWSFEVFCHLGLYYYYFFLSWRVCYLKGWSLRCSPGWGNAGHCAVMLYVREGLRGSNGAHWFPSGWACAYPRPLWVSPTTSPVRLGVSPAAAPTPTGVLNQRFEALFPRAGAVGCLVCFAPCHSSGLSMRECGATGCYPLLCLPLSLPL